MSQEELKSQLKKWLYQEMQPSSFASSAKVLDTDDFKPLCVGPNAAVWKWVVSHVYSTKSVRNTQGHLALNKKTCNKNTYKVKYGEKGETYDDTVSDLLNRRAELSGEITSTLRDVGMLEHDLERLSTDISETEDAYQKQVDVIRNIRRKSHLNDAFSGQMAYTAAQYKEYEKRIHNKVNLIKSQSEKSLETEKFFSKETTKKTLHEEGESNNTLETASMRDVRECCQNIGDFLHEASQGAFQGDKNKFTRKKEPLWTKVSEVWNEFSPDQILTSLQINVRETTALLKEMTSAVNIRRDAQNLRFKYDTSSEMRDLSSQPSLLRSVHEHLQDRSKEHLHRYIEFQKYTNQRRGQEEILTKLRGQITKHLNTLSKKGADATLLRSLLDVEMELDGYRAGLHSLNNETQRLRTIVENSLRHKQELYTKYSKIQEFQELTDKKQALIQVLVKQNIKSQSRIEAQITEIDEYVDRSLRAHEQQICMVSKKLEHCVNTEVKEFANLSLPYLMFSQMDTALKIAVMDLSINQTAPFNIRQPMLTVLKCLKFPPFQGPEMILKRCLEVKNELEESLYRIELERRSKHLKGSQGGDDNITVIITDLCDQIRAEDEKQLKRLLPLLEQRLNRTSTSLSNCVHVKQVTKDWWDQPSQHCVPWVQVEGHTLQHYVDKWTVLATSLRQFIVT